MEDFRMRTITEKSEDGEMEIHRTRSSAGYAAITLKLAGYQGFTFTNEEGNPCAEQARELIDLLEKILANDCDL